jgi:phosphoribosylformylglycinamidine synthase
VQYLTGRAFADGEGVYTSVQYLLKGQITLPAVEKIATGLLCNPLIQRYSILSVNDFMAPGCFSAGCAQGTGGSRRSKSIPLT